MSLYWRRLLLEETVLLTSVVKWSVLATITGVAVGVTGFVFLWLLEQAMRWSTHYSLYFVVLPFALPLVAWLVRSLAPEAEGHGTEKVIEAVHRWDGRINRKVVPVKLVATILTLASGGSAGKEGPCAQIGAGVASMLADWLHLRSELDRRKVVICGISAGFATVFGTPIAGALFGVEVLYLGELLYYALLPSLLAGVTAYEVTRGLGLHYFYSPLRKTLVL
ncbi:MAG: chloride channel protein [Candidatus Tectomicrobia bacterium]|uniref:Chloride channel protein n=1 Tax=Tectimicrobiota bacterium TaxID=2528274 RepID=A0A932CRD7_UNCTE|nr:chloride channel protein [Candidatus Tectomicrobia bacterium]